MQIYKYYNLITLIVSPAVPLFTIVNSAPPYDIEYLGMFFMISISNIPYDIGTKINNPHIPVIKYELYFFNSIVKLPFLSSSLVSLRNILIKLPFK